MVIYYALLDRKTPVLAKVLAAVTVGYMLSPIDLIPDFIPVLGLIDDLVLVPLMIKATLSLIPKSFVEGICAKISGEKLQKKWYFAVPIVLIYLMLVFWLWKFYFY